MLSPVEVAGTSISLTPAPGSVAPFGRSTPRSVTLGKAVTSPLAILAGLRGGRVAYLPFMADTPATLLHHRNGGTATHHAGPGGGEVQPQEPPMTGTEDAAAALKRFYAAEAAYMNGGGAAAGADFAPLAATLDPAVVLHQSPDLPWGGEFQGHAGYEDWARQMSAAFDQLAVEDLQLFARGDTVIATCRLVTRARTGGAVVDAPMAQVVTVRNGRITEFRPFYWNVPAYRAAAAPHGG